MIKISVTQKDINKGNRNCKFSCPIANAVLRQFPKASVVSVNCDAEICVYTDGRPTMYYVGSIASKKFICKFDEKGKKKVKPFKFFLKEIKLTVNAR